jgi:uncharacterized protein YbjT (DUF2867 family)
VLGATGGIGGETASALEHHDWTIRALSRRGRPDGDTTDWDWVKGDAMDRDSIIGAAEAVKTTLVGLGCLPRKTKPGTVFHALS